MVGLLRVALPFTPSSAATGTSSLPSESLWLRVVLGEQEPDSLSGDEDRATIRAEIKRAAFDRWCCSDASTCGGSSAALHVASGIGNGGNKPKGRFKANVARRRFPRSDMIRWQHGGGRRGIQRTSNKYTTPTENDNNNNNNNNNSNNNNNAATTTTQLH
jgi:hypothetical protein